MPERWIPSSHGFQVVTADSMHAIALVKDTGDADSQFKRAALLAAAPELLAALEALLTDPYGCSLCDSGKARNPAKGHQPDCPYEQARAALIKARGETT